MAIDSICSYVYTCEQCVSLAERVGRAAYKCSWCAQSTNKGRCYLPEMHRCPHLSIESMDECPTDSFNTAMLVIIGLSGVFFLACFHIGYFVLKFFEALIKDTKREQEKREQAEKLLAELAVESDSNSHKGGSANNGGGLIGDTSNTEDDHTSLTFGGSTKGRGFTTFMQRRKIIDDGQSEVLSLVSGGDRSKSHSRSRPSSPLSIPQPSEGSSRRRPASYITTTDTSTRSRRASIQSRMPQEGANNEQDGAADR